jgi:hypothetical protein
MSRYFPDFAGIYCLAIFLISLTTTRDCLLRDGDSFWHIKAGAVMLDQQSLLDRDIFSHTAFGTPWTAHEWLSEIIMASIDRLAGLEGLFCFFLLIVSLTFWLLYKVTEKNANRWVTLGCVSLALFFSFSHMAARPHLFTWLFTVLTLTILTSANRRLYWLPVIMAIWANLHGGFFLGLVLQIIFIFGAVLESCLTAKEPFECALRRVKTPVFVLLVSILATGLNPFGFELLAFPFQVSAGVSSVMIAEWRAPDLSVMWSFRFYLLALILLVSLKRSSVSWTERLLIVFSVNASLVHIRYISTMLITLTPFIARMVNNLVDVWRNRDVVRYEDKQLTMSPKSGPLAVVVIVLTLLVAGSTNRQALSFLTPDNIFGVKTEELNQLVEFLDRNQPDGNMFNEYSLGGYLMYALSSPPKVFIDGRADMYGDDILADYNSIRMSQSKRTKLLKKYNIDWVVFETGSDLVHFLQESPYWRTIYTNRRYAVLSRATLNKDY